jgi:hypothetical protein
MSITNEECGTMSVDYRTTRRAAITMDCKNNASITGITGQVLINDKTVQILAPTVKDLLEL